MASKKPNSHLYTIINLSADNFLEENKTVRLYYDIINLDKLSTMDNENQPPRRPAHYKPSVLPELPAGMDWPKETYSGSEEAKTESGIIKYLDRVWKDLITAGYAERRIVSELDHSVINAILNYERNDRGIDGKRRAIPPHLKLLSVGEAKAFRTLRARIGLPPPKV